jgi:hypothetical protein
MLRTEPYFPVRQFHQRPHWKSAAPESNPRIKRNHDGHQRSTIVGFRFVYSYRPETLNVARANEPLAVIKSPNCSNIPCEELIQIVRHLKNTGLQRGLRARLLDHDIMLLSLSVVQP